SWMKMRERPSGSGRSQIPTIMKRIHRVGPLVLAIILAGRPGLAQRSAREADQERGGELPTWKVDEPFKKDVFTFVRVKYSVSGKYGYGHTRFRWAIDFPDSDLNFAFRLQQVTSIKVDPDGKV